MHRFIVSSFILTVTLSGILSFASSNVVAAVTEVRVQLEDGVIYTIPGFGLDTEGNVLPIEADNFYVKNSSGNEVQILDMSVKASLYAVSLMASNVKQSNYWKIRRDAEEAFMALLTEVEKVREDIFSPTESGTAILLSAGTSCLISGGIGGAVGSVVPVAGTAAGALTGCLHGAATAAVWTAADQAATSALKAFETYSDRSRESVVLEEGIFLLDQVWMLSSEIDSDVIRWLNNFQALDIEEISQLLDMEISAYIYTAGMWDFFLDMYPDSDIIEQASQSRVKTIVGYSANVIQAFDDVEAITWGHVPVSFITELLFYGMNVIEQDQSPTEAAEAFKENLNDQSDRRKGFREALMSISPLSSENISANQKTFEDAEPIEYSGSYFATGGVLYDVGEEITVESTLQKLGEVYQTGSLVYEVFDKNGNSLETGNTFFSVDGYYSLIKMTDNPGDYNITIDAIDSDGNRIGHSQLRFTINNPAEGHDLSINNFTQSRASAQPSQTVTLSFNVTNNGLYQENITAQLYVLGPNGYSWTSPEQALGLIASGYTNIYNNSLSWDVPSASEDGSYTLQVIVLGDIGDITPIDNMKENFVYVGDYNIVTPTSMIGKEFEIAYDSGLEMQSECDYPYSGVGGYGYATYSRAGNSYAIAIGGLGKTADRLGGEICLVVRNGSSTGALLYSSNGINDNVGEPIYINGTPLIIYASMLDIDHMNVVVAETYSGIGFDVRERTSIPLLDTEYNSKVGNISCSEGHTYIHKATTNSHDEWDFNIFWIEDADINYKLGTCDSSGRQVFLSSPDVEKHYFVVEHQSSSQPSDYSPSIAGASDLSSKTFYWLTGILDVKDYVDVALSVSDIADSYTGGESNILTVNTVNQGTISPNLLDIVWNVTGPSNYQLERVNVGVIGSNSFVWDTNGLPSGEYQMSAKVQATGDYDTDDTVIAKTINLLPAPPTEVKQINPMEVVGKAGERYPLVVSLEDAGGDCRQDGFVYAKQIDSSGEAISLAILTKKTSACEFKGTLVLMEGTSLVRVTGHLNRLDNGLLDIPVSISTNIAPVAVIQHDYSDLVFVSPQTIILDSDSTDPDGDDIANYIWEVESPSGVHTATYGETTKSIELSESGKYSVNHYVIDGLGKQSNIAKVEIELNLSTLNSLVSLSVSGVLLIDEGNNANYSAIAAFDDGSTANVTASAIWSENSSYASISGGTLTTFAVSSNQSVTITASYTYGSVTKSDTHDVLILENVIVGDINANGVVDLTDIMLVLKITDGMSTTSAISLNADVNDDGKLGLAEAIYILQDVAEITFTGDAGTVISAGQTWMDRNLGASRVATSSTDTEAYGDLYQWGRGTDGHEKRTSPTTSVNSTTDDPGHGSFIIESSSPDDWRTPQNDNLWDGVSGINNPCPSGFRLPTETEFETERLSWGSDGKEGAYASPLKLLDAGFRDFANGTLNNEGLDGFYQTSTTFIVFSKSLFLPSGYANVGLYSRGWGQSVRCIKD